MGTQEQVNTREANQIYLWLNIMHVAFMTYYVIRVFRFVDVFPRHGLVHWVILVGFILLSNLLAVFAKRKGGVMNPIKSNRLALILQRAGYISFIAGILLASVFQVNPNLKYISLASVPLLITSIYYGYKDIITGDDSEVLDDFDLSDE